MSQPPALDNTFGAAYIGVTVAAVLYGVSCSQVFYYFQNYSKKDDLGTKAVVIVTLVSDTIHQALISHVVYTYLITDYFTPEKLGYIVWSLVVEVLFNAITALLVQSFFAIRIWKFSKGNLPIAICLAVFILGGFVSTVVYVVKGLSIPMFAQLGVLKPLAMVVNAFTVASDVLITVVFCVLLRRARSNLQRSNTMINLLIAFSVQTGMLTTLCAISSLIFILASPHTFIYISFYFLLGRLYCNSLLATLNVRKAIHGRGHQDLGISMHPFDDSNGSNAGTHQQIGIKIETVRSSSPMSKPDSGEAKAEYELESGQVRHMKRASF